MEKAFLDPVADAFGTLKKDFYSSVEVVLLGTP